MSQSSNSPEINPQQLPEQDFPQLEADPVIQPERYVPGAELQAEKSVEKDKTDDDMGATVVAPVDPDDNQVPTSANKTTTTQQGSSIPDLADDVDVIEKAWVDRAKNIINETKDDPHAQEKAFEELQIEYHKKRYGRDIKASR